MAPQSKSVSNKVPAQHVKIGGLKEGKSAVKIVLTAVSITVFLITLAIFGAAVALPAITNSQTYTVLTRSMEPSLPPGTFLVVKPTDPKQLQVGDIVTYQIESGKPEVITHRITSIQTNSTGKTQFVTKGDNNALEDNKPIQPEQIRGKLWYDIPFIGHYTDLKNSQTIEIIKYATIALLFTYGIYMIAAWTKERLKKRQQSK